jgi:hypothetical protein
VRVEAKPVERKLGALKGLLEIGPEFFEPLPDKELDL